MAVSESNPATVVKWEDAGRAPNKTKRPMSQQYQDLKFTLHRKLLDKINLGAWASIETQQLRNEVGSALTALGTRRDAAEAPRTHPAFSRFSRSIGRDRSSAAAGSHGQRHSCQHAPPSLRGAARPLAVDHVTFKETTRSYHRQDRLQVGRRSTSPRRWWTPGCPTARASTPSFRPSRSRAVGFIALRHDKLIPTTWSRANDDPGHDAAARGAVRPSSTSLSPAARVGKNNAANALSPHRPKERVVTIEDAPSATQTAALGAPGNASANIEAPAPSAS